MIGNTLGHCRVLEKIGEGGMGVVYRAQDLALGREVALKLLPEGPENADAVRRLRNEARHLSRVNHPNVETVYELGTHGTTHFIITELVRGRTLAERISEGPLSEADLVEYGTQVADALAAVHACGVIHRDLKPSNVMLTDEGRIKVLDFGLSRHLPGLSDSASSVSTVSGGLPGTIAYMAPEILRGLEASPASDIYALGAVLYEMATGRPPHVAEVLATLIYRILNEPLTPPRALRPRLSAGVESIIPRCLAREPEERFASASDVAAALRGASSSDTVPVPAPAPRRSRKRVPVVAIVVLATLAMLIAPTVGRLLHPRPRLVATRVVVAPFENDAGDRELDVIGRMTADWIAQGLTRTGVLEVVQPATTLQLTGEAAAAPAAHWTDVRLGEETGAATVVAGAYYLQGDSLVFQPRLTETASGRLIMALDPVGTRPGTPLVAIEVLRRQVMAALAERVDPALSAWSSAVGRPPSFESYRAYVEGLDASVHGRWPEALQRFQRAAAIDTSYYYARLNVGLAWLNLSQAARVDSVVRSLQPVRQHLSALEVDVLEWMVAWLRGDNEEARRVAREMAAIAPASLWAYQQALSALLTNRPAETVAALERIDPGRGVYRGWAPYWETLTAARHMLGQHDAERADARRGRRQYPERTSVLVAEIRADAASGRERDVDALIDRASSLPDEPGWTTGSVLMFAARELRAHGRTDASKRAAGRAVEWYWGRLAGGATVADSGGLAAALYLAEQWSESRALHSALFAAHPENLHYAGFLGVLAARLGDVEDARAWMARLDHDGGSGARGAFTYWRADIAALLGDRERAFALLRQARDQGHAIYFKMHSDPDLESLRSDREFQELLRPRG